MAVGHNLLDLVGRSPGSPLASLSICLLVTVGDYLFEVPMTLPSELRHVLTKSLFLFVFFSRLLGISWQANPCHVSQQTAPGRLDLDHCLAHGPE